MAAWIWRWPGVGISGVGPSAGHSLYAAALALNTEAPQGWATGVCGEAAGAAGRRGGGLVPQRRRASAGQPASFRGAPPLPPTPLKVQRGHRPAYRPCRQPCAAPPLLPQSRPSEARKKKKTKSLCRVPGGKTGGRDAGSSGSPLPTQ